MRHTEDRQPIAQCLGKGEYGSFDAADKVVKRMFGRVVKGKGHIYRCPNCLKFHIGGGTDKRK